MGQCMGWRMGILHETVIPVLPCTYLFPPCDFQDSARPPAASAPPIAPPAVAPKAIALSSLSGTAGRDGGAFSSFGGTTELDASLREVLREVQRELKASALDNAGLQERLEVTQV